MPVEVKNETDEGGLVELNKKHAVWASYASVDGMPGNQLFRAGIALNNGKSVQLFVNRETGLVVLDLISKDGVSGTELIREFLGV